MKVFGHGITLKRLNNVLALMVVVFGLYLAVSPFIPDIFYRFHHAIVVPYSGRLSQFYGEKSNTTDAIPSENRLVIPDLAINEKILEGKTIETIHSNGVWRRPATSNDPEKSNMVIVGHRFSYTSPYGTFYHLDKLKVGSKLALYWQKKEHIYEVKEIKTVGPDAVEVEAFTKEPELTLYTCTPLLTARDRLVIVAKEIKQ